MSPVILLPSEESRRITSRTPHRPFLNHLPIHGPKFLTLPHSRTVKEGNEVNFDCSVVSNGAKTTWDKDRSILSNKTNSRIYTKEENDVRVLEIRNVKQEDAGVYRIVLENKDGRIDATVRLDVVVRSRGSEQMKWCCNSSATRVSNDDGGRNGRGPIGSTLGSATGNGNPGIQNNKTEPASGKSTMLTKRRTPVFRQPLQNIQCADGDRVELVARIDGAQDVVWTRNNGQVIPNSPYFEHVHDQAEGLYKLVIHDVFPQDSGRYICEARNPPFSSLSVANLTIRATPGIRKSTGVPIKRNRMEEAKVALEGVNGKVKENGETNSDAAQSDRNSNIVNSADMESAAKLLETFESGVSFDCQMVLAAAKQVHKGTSSSAESQMAGSSASNQNHNHDVAVSPESVPSNLESSHNESLESLHEEAIAPAAKPPALEKSCADHSQVAVTTAEMTTETITESCSTDSTKESVEIDEKVTENPDSQALTIEMEPCSADLTRKPEASSNIIELEENVAENRDSPTVPIKILPEATDAILVSDLVSEPQVTAEDFKEPQSPTFRAEDGTIGRPPSVFGPGYLIAMKEETVHIRIKYSGIPQPKVQWTINGKECEDIVENTELTSVRIERVSYDDSGRYVAKVSNDHGIVLHHCFLSVEGPPEPPSTPPLAVYNPGTNAISISWSGSPYDGGSMLTAYIIQTSIDEQEWSELAIGTWLTYSLQVPNPGSSYRFRVQCQNMYGPGTPSPVSPPVYIPGIQEAISNDEEAKLLEQLDVQIRPGSLQDNYTKGEELGKGRFGVVFAATKRETGEVFAGKIIRCIKAADKCKVRQEVEIMNILRHPKLLQIMDAYENEREICIITEKINGGELFERVVADDFTLTEFDCVGFMRQICDGVRFMHQKNIIHLDLKPENILCLTRSTYNIKIIDFGLSQQYDSSTPLRVLFGTPEFISPEIINYEPISPASDMWALGVITYVLISGLSPFMGDSDSETFSNITQGLYDFEDEAFDHISEDAKDFISNLLIRRKEKRLTAVECLSHKWLAYPEPKKNIVIPTDKLKRFIIRRKWQKTGNAIRALGRMTNLYSSRRSSEAAASANRKSTDTDSGIDENARTKAESLSVEEEPEPEEEEQIPAVEKKRQLLRQSRVDSDSV